MKRSILNLLFTLTVVFTFGQETDYHFSLDEAIEYALEYNYSVINAGRDRQAAQKQKWETIASGLPQINGAISYQNQLKQPVSVVPGEIFGGEPGTFIEVVFGQPQTATATATLSQQIFDGSYIVGVQATKTFLDYSATNNEKTRLEIRKAVIESYGNVLLAIESVTILERNLANIDKTLFETSKLYENGLADQESVEQLQITKASLENNLKNARRLQKITLQMLNTVMGLNLDTPTVLTQSLEQLTKQKIDLSLVETSFTLENNVDYKLALNLNEQRYFEWKLARSRALPTLNAFVNYGTSAFSENFSFFNGDQKWFDSSIFGFDLSIPIFSSLRRSASTQRAKIAMEQAKTQLSEAEQQIRLQLENAKSNYILAIEQYHTSKKNLALAERIEMKNEIKYMEGLASSFELRQAQTQLYNAQQEYLQYMVEIINKKTALETILNSQP